MTDDELRDLAAKALTTPSLDAPLAFGVLTDALLERGLIPEYTPPRKPKPKRVAGAAERHYQFHTHAWARRVWPLRDPLWDWILERQPDRYFGVDRSLDATRLMGQALDRRTPAQMLGDIHDLYASQLINRDQALDMLNYQPRLPPTLVESTGRIQVYSNPMVPRDQFSLVSPRDRIRVVNLGLDWSAEKESE